jgi:hypothetical protein
VKRVRTDKASQGSSSFLKKRTKKLLLIRSVATTAVAPAGNQKFFVSFFQKRNTSLFLPGADFPAIVGSALTIGV